MYDTLVKEIEKLTPTGEKMSRVMVPCVVVGIEVSGVRATVVDWVSDRSASRVPRIQGTLSLR